MAGRAVAVAASRTAAWLLLFTLGWALYDTVPLEHPDFSVQFRTLIALAATYFSFGAIKVLHHFILSDCRSLVFDSG